MRYITLRIEEIDSNTFLYFNSDTQTAKTVISKIWKKFRERIELCNNGCWVYRGAYNRDGYGRYSFKVKGKVHSISPHRFTYMYFIGKVGEYDLLRHKCNNRKCCNPTHLIPGSFMDNTLDRLARQETA